MAKTGKLHLHPLVVMSIADHYTRDNVQANRDRVYGVLFGTQEGREVQIIESFEVAQAQEGSEGADETMGLRMANLEADMELFKEVYPKYECLGWYTMGGEPTPEDAQRHKLFANYNERPLLIMLDADAPDEEAKLPLKIFCEEVQIVEQKATEQFVEVEYEITADEAERVTAVHCAEVVTDENVASSVVPAYTNLSKATGMLNSRITVIHQYLKDITEGKVPIDHKILREIKGLCNRLPAMDSAAFKKDFLNEYNDALLVTYLSSITKSAGMVSDVVGKFNRTMPSGGRGRDRHQAGMGMGMGVRF